MGSPAMGSRGMGPAEIASSNLFGTSDQACRAQSLKWKSAS